MSRLFGTDGIRGVAGRDLTADLAFSVGRASVLALGRGEHPVVLVGRDTRASGEWLEEALTAGIGSAGGSVLSVGVMPTPGVAFLTVDLGADAGVVISASHNPPEDNGIKFFSSEGRKLPDETEAEIERLVSGSSADAEERGAGSTKLVDDAAERYLRHVLGAALVGLGGFRVVVDGANGAAFRLAPEALRRLGADVVPIHTEPNGENINVGCGATNPSVVADAVREHDADAGVAHDGDADRAILADADGNLIDGDHILAAAAIAKKEAGTLRGNRVVTTVMANLGFRRAMVEAGIEVSETAVGDRLVMEEMLRTDAVLGGEQSGHVIFSDLATTGDGILTAIRFLSLAASKGVSVAQLASCMQKYPQVLENVPVDSTNGIQAAAPVQQAVNEAEAALGERGRILVRPSGTEPLIRVMVEAETETEAREHAEAIASAVREASPRRRR